MVNTDTTTGNPVPDVLPSDLTSSQKLRVGILEDERHVREILCRYLRAEEMEPLQPKTGAIAERMVANAEVDLLLVDLDLGREDGVKIIRRIRAISSVPIIIVSGRTETESVSGGLDAGADDYLRKPIIFEELGARIRSVMRRKTPALPTVIVPPSLDTGDIKINLANKQIVGPLGTQVITEREVLILSQLMRNGGNPVSRDMLSRNLQGHIWDPGNRTLDVHIANIRRKVMRVGGPEGIIRTRRNLGYQIEIAAAQSGQSVETEANANAAAPEC